MPTPKKRYLNSTPAVTKQRIAKMNKQANARERNIAKAYLEAGPNIVNLAKAAYHWYNSVPWLGGKDENGNILVTGEVPTPGMRNPKSIAKGVRAITSPKGIVKGVKRITKANAQKITPKQWTAAQDAAIAKGDMAEARRLKELYDQASAKKAGLSLYSNLRHDTKSNIWHVFDESKFGSATDDGWFGKGLYLTANPKQIVKGDNHMRLNVFMKKPFLVDKNGDPDRWTVAREFNRGKTYDDWIKENSFSDNEIEDFFSKFNTDPDPFGLGVEKIKTSKAVSLEKDIAHENKIRKLFDEMNNSDGVIVSTPKVNLDEVVAPDGRFIKSADVVTYDNNGVRIGLGERNNFKLNDTRYGLIPIIGGGVGYGLHKKSNKNKNIR